MLTNSLHILTESKFVRFLGTKSTSLAIIYLTTRYLINKISKMIF